MGLWRPQLQQLSKKWPTTDLWKSQRNEMVNARGRRTHFKRSTTRQQLRKTSSDRLKRTVSRLTIPCSLSRIILIELTLKLNNSNRKIPPIKLSLILRVLKCARWPISGVMSTKKRQPRSASSPPTILSSLSNNHSNYNSCKVVVDLVRSSKSSTIRIWSLRITRKSTVPKTNRQSCLRPICKRNLVKAKLRAKYKFQSRIHSSSRQLFNSSQIFNLKRNNH